MSWNFASLGFLVGTVASAVITSVTAATIVTIIAVLAFLVFYNRKILLKG